MRLCEQSKRSKGFHSSKKVQKHWNRQIGVLKPRSCAISVRFSLHKIEQELGTEIRPIPKSIDKQLYVAEFQICGEDGEDAEKDK